MSHTQIGAQHRFQRAEQRRERGPDAARPRREAGEAKPEIERAEGKQESHVAHRHLERSWSGTLRMHAGDDGAEARRCVGFAHARNGG